MCLCVCSASEVIADKHSFLTIKHRKLSKMPITIGHLCQLPNHRLSRFISLFSIFVIAVGCHCQFCYGICACFVFKRKKKRIGETRLTRLNVVFNGDFYHSTHYACIIHKRSVACFDSFLCPSTNKLARYCAENSM